MPTTEMVAVNQCSGNSRSVLHPARRRRPGRQRPDGQCAGGAASVLKHVLDRAGVKAGAVDVRFDGMDGPVDPATPDFAKALDYRPRPRRRGDAGLVHERQLPILNGYPLASSCRDITGPTGSSTSTRSPCWMRSSTTSGCRPPTAFPTTTAPARRRARPPPRPGRSGAMTYGASSPTFAGGVRVAAGRPLPVRGIAFDGGSGIAQVLVSADGGVTWAVSQARQGSWPLLLPPVDPHDGSPRGRPPRAQGPGHQPPAASRQPSEPRWNPAGYMRNVIESVSVQAA